MKKQDLIAIGVDQYTKRNGGNPFNANQFVSRVNQIISDCGEGFAVFVGSRLAWFGCDIGAARNEARNQMSGGHKRDSVSVKRITV